MSKLAILQSVIEALQKEEGVLISATLSAKEAATESEAKPENEYDTRGLEQSYLAAGQGRRVADLQSAIMNLKSLPLHIFDRSTPIDISALVTIEGEAGDQKVYFLLPTHGGIKLKHSGKEILTLSPDSPLGQSIFGRHLGDTIEVRLADQLKPYVILSVE
jgi:transcription elongation GreA/GreB family factor